MVVTLFSRKFLRHVLHIYVCASEFFFDYFDYGFSPKMVGVGTNVDFHGGVKEKNVYISNHER